MPKSNCRSPARQGNERPSPWPEEPGRTSFALLPSWNHCRLRFRPCRARWPSEPVEEPRFASRCSGLPRSSRLSSTARLSGRECCQTANTWPKRGQRIIPHELKRGATMSPYSSCRASVGRRNVRPCGLWNCSQRWAASHNRRMECLSAGIAHRSGARSRTCPPQNAVPG